MTGGLPLVVLAWLLLGIAAFDTLRLARDWRRGQGARVAWLAGLAAVPRRYLVDVHAVVARKPEAARMHMTIAGGLLGATALLLLGAIPVLRHSALYWVLVALGFLAATAGAALVARRRLPRRPASLSAGPFLLLPAWLSSYALGGLLGALGVLAGSTGFAGIGFVLAAFGGLMLMRLLRLGPMRHAVAGTLHLAAHPRAARFDGAPAADLQPIGLDDPATLGIRRIEDFAWNRLLGFDACIQCGRCEDACPAFAAGQPLNPKALIQDLVGAIRPDSTPYAGSPHPGIAPRTAEETMADGALVPSRIRPETIWSCTTCRACVASCPMMIEHVDAIVGMRRHLTLATGETAGKADAVLGELRHAGNTGGFDPERRLDFAGGDLRVLAPGETTDILLWLGDGAFDPRYGRSLRALVAIMKAAGLDFAVLGVAERDCGDVARRLGDEAGFARLAHANVATLAAYRFSRIVTADPHALHVLRHEYRAFGGVYHVIHHTTLIDELLQQGTIRLEARPAASVTYHDPCYLGRYNGETEAPRRIVAQLGGRFSEMERHGVASFCCGGGGGAPVSDIAGERRIPDLRMDQARSTGAEVVAVACPGCTAMLEGVPGENPAVRDIAELVHAAIAPVARAVPA